MTVMERCAATGIVPVVVIEHTEDAIPTAKALLEGGIDIMEITMRTAACLDSIRAISKECPEVLVGAGTVLTLEQCKACVEAGAKFIVAPGYDPEVVDWCVANQVAVIPGCVTPSEIMMALKAGLKTVKFFPANIYGGLKAMKSLSGPFGGVTFLPTGGVNGENIQEYISSPFIKAVGGSWMCAKASITGHKFDEITALSKAARAVVKEVRG